MRLLTASLCLVMVALSLIEYTRGRSPSRWLKLLFWVALLASSVTRFWPLLILTAIFLGLVLLARRFPLHAVALESRIALLWSKKNAGNADELFAQMPGLMEAKNEELHEKLNHRNPDVKFLALATLAERKDRTAVPRLLTLLEEGAAEDHVTLLDALGKIGDPAAGQSVAKFLGHDKEYVRERALICLRALRNTAVLPAIIEQLQKEKSPELMRLGLRTLYDLGAEDAIKAHWNTIPPHVKSEYFNAIYEIADERLKELSCFASCAAEDASEEIRQQSRALRRKMLLHEYEQQYADIFPARNVVKSASDRAQPLDLRTDRLLSLAAGADGHLEVHPGAFMANVSARYQHQAENRDDTDIAEIVLQVADDQGDLWEVVFSLPASILFDSALASSGPQYYGDVAENVRQAFRDRVLLRGLQTMDDSREGKSIRIGEDPVEIFLKYQSPVMDVALHKGSENGPVCLLIRTFRVNDDHGGQLPPFVSTCALMALVSQLVEERRSPDSPPTGAFRVHKVGHGATGQANVRIV